MPHTDTPPSEQELSRITSLISKIHAGSSAYLKAALSEQGLPELVSSHGNILFQLSQNERLTMSEITRAIHRDKSTTTALINKLEKEGYVERVHSETDNRVTYITLTQKGREYTAATGTISRELTERCYRGFTDGEKQEVYRLLARIAENFS